jgi:hypothetical protein
MSAKSRLVYRTACVTAAIILAATAHPLFAQAPSITSISPQAVQPGGTIDLTIRGGNLAGVTKLWTSFPGQAVLSPDVKDNGKNAAQVVYRITVPATTSVGLHAVRIATPKGISSMKLVVIDDLKSVAQVKTNKSPQAAQAIEIPCAVDGVVDSLSRNYYKFKATAGRKISFEVLARRMGSALDPMIRILDSEGREITYSDDEPGLVADSQLCHIFKSAGEYLIEVRDIRYQGGATYNYRLRVGDFPCVTVPYPMGAKRGTEVALSFAGSHVGDVVPTKIKVPADAKLNWLNVGAKRKGGKSSGFAALSIGDAAEVVEKEPNGELAQATRAELGAGLNGRFDTPGDIDRFVFAAKKGQKFAFASITRSQGAPSDLVLKLTDAKGKQLATADDTGANDGIINYTFPADGDYILAVEDLHRRGGTAYAYRIAVAAPGAGFALSAVADRANVPAGGATSITVNVIRGTYKGPIEVSAINLPPGITSDTAIVPTNGTSVILTLSGAPNTPSGTIHANSIVGKAKIGNVEQTVTADVDAAIMASHNAMPRPPHVLASASAVALVPAAQIALKTDTRELVFGRDLKATLKVTVQRQAGFDEAVTLAVTPAKGGLPANVTAAVKPIPKGKNEIDIVFTATSKAAIGEFTAVLTGTIKQGKTTVAQVVPGIRLKLQAPLKLTIDSGDGKLKKGGQLKVKVIVERNPALKAPITLTFKKLPKGVTAPAATIPADKNEVEILLTAKEDAQVGKAAGVVIAGAATVGKAKFAANSPAVKLTVE